MAVGYAVSGLAWIAAIVAPIALFAHNFGQVRLARGPEYSQFGKLAAASLPPEGAIVLSDDSVRLFSLHSALVTKGSADKFVLVDTSGLERPAYHAHLARLHPKIWPEAFAKRPAGSSIEQLGLIQLMYQLSQSLPVYYLHSSSGAGFGRAIVGGRALGRGKGPPRQPQTTPDSSPSHGPEQAAGHGPLQAACEIA